ncbi:MAG TPA: hypothetical protein VNV63_04125, partial [Nitrospiria bacterium]|nr:hypothetical protein [Nitrospiria bacterium]
MNGIKRIDLGEARTSKEARVFSGRERGKYWRQYFKLDQLDQDDSTVEVVIPEDILSVNLSFFLSLFGESVRHLGSVDFKAKYHFVCDPSLLP